LPWMKTHVVRTCREEEFLTKSYRYIYRSSVHSLLFSNRVVLIPIFTTRLKASHSSVKPRIMSEIRRY
jgi:hypothetical protein